MKLILTNSEQWVLGWGTTGLLRDVGPWWVVSITSKATKWKDSIRMKEEAAVGWSSRFIQDRNSNARFCFPRLLEGTVTNLVAERDTSFHPHTTLCQMKVPAGGCSSEAPKEGSTLPSQCQACHCVNLFGAHPLLLCVPPPIFVSLPTDTALDLEPLPAPTAQLRLLSLTTLQRPFFQGRFKATSSALCVCMCAQVHVCAGTGMC